MRNASQQAFSHRLDHDPGIGAEPTRLAGGSAGWLQGGMADSAGASVSASHRDSTSRRDSASHRDSASYGDSARASAGEVGMVAARRFASPFDIALPPAPAPAGVRIVGTRLALAGPVPIRRGFTGPSAVAKRAVDLVGGVMLLLLALPVLLAVAAALWCEGRGPLLFVQRRIGRDGRPFACLKLRTMAVDAESRLAELLAASPAAQREWAADRKLRRDPRVTPLGRLVRKLSIDELPQLANVIAGQMSLVGPRPIVQAEVPRYGPFLADYCAVKPGMTGMWQVSGRNDVSYGERVQLDRHYARHASLLLDLRIAWRTVPTVLGGVGCY